MDYVTAAEIAKQWKISSRMAAYYCENGRIDGAVKKGKTWFIPAGAQKPIDKRYSKTKVTIKDTTDFQITQNYFNEAEEDNRSVVYHTGDVYRHLGLTRETLRYYEEIGLITPKRSQYSQYREFDFYDMSHLMAIDFYRKRGFSPLEIKALLKSTSPAECDAMIIRQMDSLQHQIASLQEMLKRLKTADTFRRETGETIGEFEIRDLPSYYVKESLPSVASFEEYRDKVLSYLDEDEDILSNMVRMVTFDKMGYKGSEMFLVKHAAATEKIKNQRFLPDGKSLYTTFAADNNDASVMEKMFTASYQWAEKHKLEFCGTAYIFIRFVMLNEHTDRNYYEVWIPLK